MGIAVLGPASPAAADGQKVGNAVTAYGLTAATTPEVTDVDLDEATIDELDEHLEELDEAMETAEAQLGELTEAHSQKQAAIDAANGVIADSSERFSSVSEAVGSGETLASRLGALAHSTKGASDALAEATDTVNRKQPIVTALVGEVERAQSILSDLDEHIDSVESVIAQLEEEAARAQAEAEAEAAAEVSRAEESAASSSDSSSDSSSSGSSSSSNEATYNASAAQNAVDFAYNQIGKPYVFGAAGPGSYDCSGLTQAAFAVSGVSLAHNAATQINQTQSIARSDLRQGDLVFYQNGGHVAIYIGSGEVIHSPKPGDVVKVAPVDMMTPTSYGRVG
ncbi:C40 family peptidase [Natronoglycomyces albus]|uniref:C40 family peptidase n=1 Tax=Natronoglycomyces albus TaxID=2811108 RepID=A0A895XL36_9ACTN|nr:C40 family peptidase [Natronoglycomyces albus]QSB04512.1 C40 family peptidase [Natronoglycomyces albus]